MNHVFAHAVGTTFKQSKSMPPVGHGKNPIIGFAMGFLFGPFGVGLYLKSVGDFVITLGIVLAGSALTVGVVAPLLWMLCGAWAFVRISNSNQTPPPGASQLGALPDTASHSPFARKVVSEVNAVAS
jgi:hypothetical protein